MDAETKQEVQNVETVSAPEEETPTEDNSLWEDEI